MTEFLTSDQHAQMPIAAHRQRLKVMFEENEARPLPDTALRSLLLDSDRFAAELFEVVRLAAEGRAAGRAEAAAILMNQSAEEWATCSKVEDLVEARQDDPSGESTWSWNEEKVREFFDAPADGGVMGSMLERSEAAYWELLGKQQTAPGEKHPQDLSDEELDAVSYRGPWCARAVEEIRRRRKTSSIHSTVKTPEACPHCGVVFADPPLTEILTSNPPKCGRCRKPLWWQDRSGREPDRAFTAEELRRGDR